MIDTLNIKTSEYVTRDYEVELMFMVSRVRLVIVTNTLSRNQMRGINKLITLRAVPLISNKFCPFIIPKGISQIRVYF